jgi:hypothetical protein
MGRKSLKLSFLFILALIGGTGSAQAESICHSVEKVKGLAGNCRQNKIFAEAADVCIQRLESAIKLQQGVLAFAMGAAGASSAEAQDAKVANNKLNVENAAATLSSLLQQAEAARETMADYTKNFTYPAGMSKEKAEGLGLGKIFQKFPCFTTNQNKVSGQINKMDDKITELKVARDQAAQLAAASGNALGRLEQSESMPTAFGADALSGEHHGLDPSQVYRGEDRAPTSDISGTKEEKKR